MQARSKAQNAAIHAKFGRGDVSPAPIFPPPKTGDIDLRALTPPALTPLVPTDATRVAPKMSWDHLKKAATTGLFRAQRGKR